MRKLRVETRGHISVLTVDQFGKANGRERAMAGTKLGVEDDIPSNKRVRAQRCRCQSNWGLIRQRYDRSDS